MSLTELKLSGHGTDPPVSLRGGTDVHDEKSIKNKAAKSCNPVLFLTMTSARTTGFLQY